jgi:hypothetical protein
MPRLAHLVPKAKPRLWDHACIPRAREIKISTCPRGRTWGLCIGLMAILSRGFGSDYTFVGFTLFRLLGSYLIRLVTVATSQATQWVKDYKTGQRNGRAMPLSLKITYFVFLRDVQEYLSVIMPVATVSINNPREYITRPLSIGFICMTTIYQFPKQKIPSIDSTNHMLL